MAQLPSPSVPDSPLDGDRGIILADGVHSWIAQHGQKGQKICGIFQRSISVYLETFSKKGTLLAATTAGVQTIL